MRAIGAETDPNILAAALVCSIPFCVHFLFSSQTVHHKTIAFLCAGLNICAVLLTYSRAIIIVMFVTIIILLISNLNKLSIRHAGFYLAGAFVALFLIVKFIPDSQLMKRLSSLSSFSTNTSLSRRSSYIRAGLDALAKRPLIGYGPGAFPQIYSATTSAAAYATRREAFFREAHNTYLQTAVETGITGGVLFAVIAATGLIYLFKSVKQLPKTGIITEGLAKATLISMVSFFISIMFLTIPHHKYIWLHIGLAVSFYRFAKQPGMIICEKRLSI
jgi:O-antigen ligase